MTSRITAAIVGLAAGLFGAQAHAYTLSGTIPPGTRQMEIDLHKPLERGNITFTFKAGEVNAGVAYDVAFCIGPESNPCGSLLSHAIQVPAGGSRTFTIDALVFSCNVLTVGQGTRVAIPYTIEVVQP